MRSLLLAILCLALISATAFAQAGNISVYSDLTGANCLINDAAPGLLPIYVFHTLTLGATACQFAAPVPSCMTAAIWLSDTALYPVTIGNSQSGVAIGYGVCLPGPIQVLTINVFGQGLSQTCCEYFVIPDPNVASGQIEVVDCANDLLFATGGVGYVNADPNMCGCEPATEAATWGGIKAIYAE